MEMCYDGALVMPNNYAVVSEEEMTYIDGGWSGDLFVKNICAGVAAMVGGWRGPIAKEAGITMNAVKQWASAGYAWITANVSAQVCRMIAIIGGVIAACVAGACIATGIYLLGTVNMF